MKHLFIFVLLLILINCNQVLQAQWVQTSGPYGYYVYCLTQNETNIFAGTPLGIYSSTNNGANWSRVFSVPGNTWVLSMAANGDNIFAGVETSVERGVFRSTNNGINWENVLNNEDVVSLAVDGSNIFAGTWQGLFVSNDNGTSWTKTFIPGSYIISFAFDGNNILAGTDHGLYISTDSGISWKLEGMTNIWFGTFAFGGNKIFAGTDDGIYLSTDDGTNWTLTGLPNIHVESLVIIGADIFAGTFNGMYLSTDNGINWTHLNNTLNNSTVYSLILRGNNILAGSESNIDYRDGGVFLSANKGANWTQVGLPNSSIQAIASGGSVLFAGGDPNGVSLSSNNGYNWTQVAMEDNHAFAIAVSGKNIFVAGNGVFRSTDNGINWTYVGLIANNVNALAISGTNIFAAATWGGVLLSTDNGTTWTEVSNGLTGGMYSIAACGINIFAGNEYGVFLSTNNGASWKQVNNGLTDTGIISFGISGGNVFVSTFSGVFLSTNSGTNWLPANEGLTYNLIGSFCVSGNNVFAGAYYGGVFLSTNTGTTWTNVSTGLDGYAVYSLAVHGTNIFVGTDLAGVWRRPLSELIPNNDNCPLSQGYWKNHPDKWPAALPMMLGTLNMYNKSQLLSAFGTPVKGDASLILACQLIAAKLNVANSSLLPTDIQNAIANSDAAIGSAKIPANVRPNSVLGNTMISLAAILENFNNNKHASDCHSGLSKEKMENTQNNILNGLADRYELFGNFPNPFNPSTKISFITPEDNLVSLKIYNSIGQLVRTLVKENMNKGYHTLEWNATNDNGNNLATGIYLYRLQAGNFTQTSKMIYIK